MKTIELFLTVLSMGFSMSIPFEHYYNGQRDYSYFEDHRPIDEISYADDQSYYQQDSDAYPLANPDHYSNWYGMEKQVVQPDPLLSAMSSDSNSHNNPNEKGEQYSNINYIQQAWMNVEDGHGRNFNEDLSIPTEVANLNIAAEISSISHPIEDPVRERQDLFSLSPDLPEPMKRSPTIHKTTEQSLPHAYGIDPRSQNSSADFLLGELDTDKLEIESSGSFALNETDSNDFSEEKDIDNLLMRDEFLSTVDKKFRSLVFNPAAQSHEKFQACSSPTNETGSCKYLQHCLLPNIVSSVDKFMDNVCIIEGRYIGVCCPRYPTDVIKVMWENTAEIKENIPVSLPEKECGLSSKKRIIGGSKADPKNWPWMAALITMSKGQFYCGGVLINNFYVLTAAHCTYRIPKNQIMARLGEYDFGVKDHEYPGEDFPIVEIKRHGQYSRRTLHNDIALLKLGRAVKFTKSVVPICLPKNELFVGSKATLAGWGNVKGGGASSKVLQEVTLPVVENRNCSREHGLVVPDILICTRSQDKNKGACNGDSGGPLMMLNEKSKRWSAIGIVSWGRRGCDPGYPTVYTRVSKYLDWIKMHAM